MKTKILPQVKKIMADFAKILKNFFKKKWVKRSMIVILFLFLFYLGFINWTEPTEIGLTRNMITGKMWTQEKGGFHITPPWVWVTRIDTRPMRVEISSACHAYSAKLVQFDKDAWEEFVAIEGWRYYWWDNRISFNYGYDEEYRGMRDVIRGYAYSAKSYPFVVVLDEYETE